MGEPNFDVFPLSEDEWTQELQAMSTTVGEGDIFVSLNFLDGKFRGTGFLPQVDGRTIVIPLQRQSPSGLGNACIQFSLPRSCRAVSVEKSSPKTEQ